MRATGLWTTLMALLAGAAAWGELAECQLTERPLDPPVYVGGFRKLGTVSWTAVKSVPALRSAEPLYVRSTGTVAVLDQSDGVTYDTLYWDTDRDRELADERPLRGEPCDLPEVSVIFPAMDAGATFGRVRLALTAPGTFGHPRLARVIDRARFGEVMLGGQPTKVALVGDFYGRRVSWWNAKLWLDRDGDGQFSESEKHRLSRILKLDGELLNVDIPEGLETLRIGPYEGQTLRLRVVGVNGDGEQTHGTLVLGAPETRLSLRAEGQVLDIPIEEFRGQSVSGHVTDVESGTGIEVRLSWARLSEAARQGKLVLGGPLQVALYAVPYERDEDTLLQVAVRTTTEAGDTVAALRRDGRTVPAGKLIVTGPDGTVLRASDVRLAQLGTFSAEGPEVVKITYPHLVAKELNVFGSGKRPAGRGGLLRLSIPKAEPPGKYTIEAFFDLAPYQTEKLTATTTVRVDG